MQGGPTNIDKEVKQNKNLLIDDKEIFILKEEYDE